jgi:hypothetical protein
LNFGQLTAIIAVLVHFHALDMAYSSSLWYLQVSLQKPAICDSDVWDLVEECWSRDEQARPTFAEIYLFLKRKTIAFDVPV